MKNKDKLLDIFNSFDGKTQRNKLCEEFRELQDELFIYVEYEDECNMLTEIADVIILMLQFMYDYGYDLDDLDNEINKKIDRTLQRIKEGYYDKDKGK